MKKTFRMHSLHLISKIWYEDTLYTTTDFPGSWGSNLRKNIFILLCSIAADSYLIFNFDVLSCFSGWRETIKGSFLTEIVISGIFFSD